jgi:hypothetical protein
MNRGIMNRRAPRQAGLIKPADTGGIERLHQDVLKELL